MKKLSEEARKNRNAYYRQWRKDNPEKAVAIQERYWAKKQKQAELQRKKDEGS